MNPPPFELEPKLLLKQYVVRYPAYSHIVTYLHIYLNKHNYKCLYLVKRERYLTEEQIKIRILAYLYNRGEIGANAYVIQHRANIPLQEYNRFRGFLEDLCKKSLLEKYEEETGGTRARTNYKISEKGRITVSTCRLSHMQELLGSIEDLFGPVDKKKQDKD